MIMSRHHTHLDTRRWAKVRHAAFERDGWRCTLCGKAGWLEAHHEPPLEAGGAPYELAGIKTLCRACHIEAHADATPGRADWRAFMRDLAAED